MSETSAVTLLPQPPSRRAPAPPRPRPEPTPAQIERRQKQETKEERRRQKKFLIKLEQWKLRGKRLKRFKNVEEWSQQDLKDYLQVWTVVAGKAAPELYLDPPEDHIPLTALSQSDRAIALIERESRQCCLWHPKDWILRNNKLVVRAEYRKECGEPMTEEQERASRMKKTLSVHQWLVDLVEQMPIRKRAKLQAFRKRMEPILEKSGQVPQIKPFPVSLQQPKEQIPCPLAS